MADSDESGPGKGLEASGSAGHERGPSDERTSGRQDLYVGLVRAIGTDLSDAIEALRICFGRAGYPAEAVKVVKLSGYLRELLSVHADRSSDSPTLSSPEAGRYEYYRSRMDAGDWVRTNYEANILAQCASVEVMNWREAHEPSASARPGLVFVFDSLMHKDEVALLRAVYGRRFFLMAVHSTSAEREAHLLDELRSSDPSEIPRVFQRSAGDGARDFEEDARYKRAENERVGKVDQLMRRDEGISDPDSPHSPAPPNRRVAIRKTFALADVFVSVEEAAAARRADQTGVLDRFVQKIFDEPFHTPTRDELGMAHAYVAARRSGSLARNVGAAICDADGEVLATGTNEVPSPDGGQYWPPYDGSNADVRDHQFEYNAADGETIHGVDSNDLIKIDLAADFARRLLAAVPSHVKADQQITGQVSLFEEYIYRAEEMIPQLLEDQSVAASKLFDVIEYSRHVHAEMAALMSCARRGTPTKGATLYCTTFPCHECSRHIVAAGISRVVYVEPYEKSRVSELHADSVEVELYAGRDPDPTPDPGVSRVRFEPFMGVSPDRQADLYAYTRRKLETKSGDLTRVGRARPWQFGPRSPLRSSVAADEVTVGVAELLMVAASERYVAKALRKLGVHTDMFGPVVSRDQVVPPADVVETGTSRPPSDPDDPIAGTPT